MKCTCYEDVVCGACMTGAVDPVTKEPIPASYPKATPVSVGDGIAVLGSNVASYALGNPPTNEVRDAALKRLDEREEYAEQCGYPAFQDEPSAYINGFEDGVEYARGRTAPPADDVREVLAGTINDNHQCTREWETLKLRTGIERTNGDDYAIRTAYKAADAVITKFEIRLPGVTTNTDRIAVLRELLAETSDEDEDYWDREALEHRIVELRKRGKND